MVYPETAEGFAIHDHKKWTEFKKTEFKLKTFEDYDVDIAIDACGVCGSDVHTITGGWGDQSDMLPLVVGHEVVGRAVRVGKKVTTIKVGDRVGVGAQIGADLTCNNCKADQENYCPNQIDTYGAKYPSDGVISQGGYSSHMRAHEYFTFKIPDNIPDAIAAPFLCAGLTVYSPLVRLGAGPGKKVAIVGVGGLGHFAIMLAAALGAEVYVLSHTEGKRDDAMKMGATEFIYTGEKGWHEKYAFTFDFILSTADVQLDMDAYMSCMKVFGHFHSVGLPDKPLPELKAQQFAPGMYYVGGSHIGNRPEMIAMFELVSKQNIKTWVQEIPISEEGCAKAVQSVKDNKVRYRHTLVGFDAVFGKRT